MRLVAIGLAAGVFSAFFGVGGGIVVVPLLILVAGLSEREATATSLAAIVITATARGRSSSRSAARSTWATRHSSGCLPQWARSQAPPGSNGCRESMLTYGFAALLTVIGVVLLTT